MSHSVANGRPTRRIMPNVRQLAATSPISVSTYLDPRALRLDVLSGRLWRGNQPITLRPKLLVLLLYLAEHRQQLVPQQVLLEAVWPDVCVNEGEVRRSVRELRYALDDDAKAPIFIETVHRRGYRFIGELDISRPAEPPAHLPPPVQAVGSGHLELQRRRLVKRCQVLPFASIVLWIIIITY